MRDMDKNVFIEKMELNPIIGALKDKGELEAIKASQCEIVFVLTTDIFEIEDTVRQLEQEGKMVFVHFDLIDGISKNQTALKYIIERVRPHGIITTKSNIIMSAKKLNVLTVQRHFILDSLSLQNTIEVIKESNPDAVEIMPGLINKVVEKMKYAIEVPIIAGGLIEEKSEVTSCISAGVTAISTTRKHLWNI